MEEIENILINWAKKNPSIKRIYLFGSRIKGNSKDDSDLDVAMEIDKMPNDENALATWFGEKDGWKNELQPKIKHPLHLELYEPGTTQKICNYIDGESVKIYDKDER